jgi:hypothetical protein
VGPLQSARRGVAFLLSFFCIVTRVMTCKGSHALQAMMQHMWGEMMLVPLQHMLTQNDMQSVAAQRVQRP